MERSSDLVERLDATLSTDEPTPLYNQIASVVRWEISLGRLPIGSLLPPVRSLSEALGINYHTVRRGYRELANEGVVESRRGVGVRVVSAPGTTHWTPAVSNAPTTDWCWVLDNSLSRGAQLAQAVLDRWSVDVGVWSLDSGPPPAGPILASRVNCGAFAARFPDREGDLHPMDLDLDSVTLSAIGRLAKESSCSAVLLVGDPETTALRDLAKQLPRVGLTTHREAEMPSDGPEVGSLAVVTGEVWDRMSWEDQRQPRLVPLQSSFTSGSLARVARALNWESA